MDVKFMRILFNSVKLGIILEDRCGRRGFSSQLNEMA
jgi:hypothetical protein